MKKISIVLCAILCLSLLAGCSGDINVRNENGSSIPTSDLEPIVSNAVSDSSTTTTAESHTTSATTESVTTTTTETPVVITTVKPVTTTSVTTARKTTITKKTTQTTSKKITTTAAPKTNATKMLLSIAVDSMPTKTTYVTGDELDTTGLTLKLTYSDGSTETVSTGYTTHGFTKKTPGTKKVTVAYKVGPSTYTCTFDVKVEKKQHGTPNIKATFHEDMAKEVLTLLNNERKKEGLSELKMDYGNLMIAAKIRAKEITIDWAHERPDHDRWDTVFDEEGAGYPSHGENLAKGHNTAQGVFDGWMNSADHKANMMHPKFTHISIVCMEYDGNFYWVQLFGAK